MYFEPEKRQQFARDIAEKAGLLNDKFNRDDIFIDKFSNHKELVKLNVSEKWMGEVVAWVSEHKTEMAESIKSNYDKPAEIFQKIIKNKPI